MATARFSDFVLQHCTRRLLGARASVTMAGRGLRFGLPVTDDAPPDRPGVAALPFANMGGSGGPNPPESKGDEG